MGVTLYEVLTGEVPFPGETDLQVFAAAGGRARRAVRAEVVESDVVRHTARR